MKQLLLILIFGFISLTANGQDSIDIFSVNKALNQIRKQETLGDLRIMCKTYPCILRSDDFNDYYKKLNLFIDSISLRQIIENKYSAKKVWNENELEKATILSPSQIDSLQKHNIKYENQTSLFFELTLPAYDNSKKYMVIGFGYLTTLSRGSGTYYLLKNINSDWQILTTFSNWAR